MAHMDPASEIPSDDELDEILRGTKDGQDIFDTSHVEAEVESLSKKKKKKPAGEDTLGLDEEIKVTKKRQPIPKLDEARLLSDHGIPKLQRISKDRLKLKGKGHEYGDIARMLNMYQLWLDDLYPRAKFADGLAIIEKVGHAKTMQRMRKEWIDGGKSKNRPDNEEEEEAGDDVMRDQPVQESVEQAGVEQMEGVESESAPREVPRPEEHTENTTTGAVENEPDMDELDALLAEEPGLPEPQKSVSIPSRQAPTEEDMFADEMEAMADMDDMWG
ncbi:Swi3-domain-containing protein [Massarina eburnea CBS 473.64]|uniref:Chromosome segregation in meiosis protein n=1 Tax=Massarina eburnea CBS 473.64 TaxID=1395130 RepID=A0A6A6SAV3_9PLEO|nr:Swi3-domain-containing protein [Massarina eburnea CBS 473.64]